MPINSIDAVFSFDTTGSMYPCLTQVRRTVSQMVKQLFKDIPDLRIAVIAHGDYCDEGNPYTIQINDFSTNPDNIVNFVNNVKPTFGGDWPECYELVLHEARTKLNWQSGRSKILVMIGDAIPHETNYPGNKNHIDWENELGLLKEASINVYGVHAMPGIRKASKGFYQTIADKTDGYYLTLDQFATVGDMIMAICYKQEGDEQFNNFIQQVYDSGRATRDFRNIVRTMGGKIGDDKTNDDGLTPVPAGRFQVLKVDNAQSIKDFVTDNGITFKKGRGFYQLTGTESVGQYKEILMVDKNTGDIFNGPEVRRILGLSPQTDSKGANEKLRPVYLDKYNVFIQSTSHSRNLDAGPSLVVLRELRRFSLKQRLMFLLVVAALLMTSSTVTWADTFASIFLTGHDPDFHALVGGNAVGAKNINNAAINFVMDPVYNSYVAGGVTKFLYVAAFPCDFSGCSIPSG
jgi:hypothetical protein